MPLERRGQAGITWLELAESPSPLLHVETCFLLAELWVKGFPVLKGLVTQLCTPWCLSAGFSSLGSAWCGVGDQLSFLPSAVSGIRLGSGLLTAHVLPLLTASSYCTAFEALTQQFSSLLLTHLKACRGAACFANCKARAPLSSAASSCCEAEGYQEELKRLLLLFWVLSSAGWLLSPRATCLHFEFPMALCRGYFTPLHPIKDPKKIKNHQQLSELRAAFVEIQLQFEISKAASKELQGKASKALLLPAVLSCHPPRCCFALCHNATL